MAMYVIEDCKALDTGFKWAIASLMLNVCVMLLTCCSVSVNEFQVWLVQVPEVIVPFVNRA